MYRLTLEVVSEVFCSRYVESQGVPESLYGGIHIIERQEMRTELQIVIEVKRPASLKSCPESRHAGWLYV